MSYRNSLTYLLAVPLL